MDKEQTYKFSSLSDGSLNRNLTQFVFYLTYILISLALGFLTFFGVTVFEINLSHNSKVITSSVIFISIFLYLIYRHHKYQKALEQAYKRIESQTIILNKNTIKISPDIISDASPSVFFKKLTFNLNKTIENTEELSYKEFNWDEVCKFSHGIFIFQNKRKVEFIELELHSRKKYLINRQGFEKQYEEILSVAKTFAPHLQIIFEDKPRYFPKLL